MNNLYVVITKNHKARLYQAVTDELDNARYHLYDFLKENIRYRSYDSIKEIENVLDDYAKDGVILYWARVQTSESFTLLS